MSEGLRRLTDPVGKRVLRIIQSDETEKQVRKRLVNDSKNSNEPKGVPDVREAFLIIFAERLKTYIVVAAGIVVISLSIDLFICGQLPNQTPGLMIDMLGALILGRGVLRGPYTIAGSNGLSSSNQVQDSFIEGSVDGVFGISLLVLGIGAQLLAALGAEIQMSACLL